MTIAVLGAKRVSASFLARAAAAEAAAVAITAQGAEVVEDELRARAPVLTGTLRDSIGVQEELTSLGYSEVGVGAGVEYDRYYQFGTRRQPPRPYAGEAAAAASDDVVGGAVRIIAGVL